MEDWAVQGDQLTLLAHETRGLADFSVTDEFVELEELEVCGHEGRYQLRFGRPEQRFSWPIIPGYAYRADSHEVVAEFHRAQRVNATTWMAISLDALTIKIPRVQIRFRSYWTPDAGIAVLAGPQNWSLVDGSKIRDHEHDIFDWAKIDRTTKLTWHNEVQDWWCSQQNFEKLIRDDFLGWRSDPMIARPLE
ncbi:MAG: hypothetical protein U1E49_03005 [Hyphomicrobiaceae bacterium]